jgi:acyl-CoA dehydrogenase
LGCFFGDWPVDAETFDLLRTTVRRFVQERLIPAEDRVEEEDAVPEEIVAEMRELGLFGLSIPTGYGGLGLTMTEEAGLIWELGRTSLAFRSVIGTTVGIGSQGIVIDGTEEQKRYWLPRLASGEIIASFALTEPGAGSDAGSLATTATRRGDLYCLNGVKRYITNAPRAGVFTVMARSEPDKSGTAGISAFIVPADSPGLSLGKPEKKMGQRGTIVSDVIFEECVVPASAIIGGKPGMGFKTAMKVLGPQTHPYLGTGGRKATDRGIGAVCARAAAIRPTDRRIPTDPGHACRQPHGSLRLSHAGRGRRSALRRTRESER